MSDSNCSPSAFPEDHAFCDHAKRMMSATHIDAPVRMLGGYAGYLKPDSSAQEAAQVRMHTKRSI